MSPVYTEKSVQIESTEPNMLDHLEKNFSTILYQEGSYLTLLLDILDIIKK